VLIAKLSNANNLEKDVDIIQKHHIRDIEIICCFSRKECEAIAAHLLKFWFSVAAEIITLVYSMTRGELLFSKVGWWVIAILQYCVG
jgi:hypothetical protein